MPPLAPAALFEQSAAGELQPVYVLRGEDEAAKDQIVNRLIDTLDEDLRPFNLLLLSAVDATTADGRAKVVEEVLGAARTLPMMAPRRLVIVRDADRILFPKRRGAAEEEEDGDRDGDVPSAGKGETAEAELESYVKNPEPLTTLVLVCRTWDDRRRIAKLLVARSAIVTCGSPETEAEATSWVMRHAKAVGVNVGQPAARELVDRTGLDITALRQNLERVSLYAHGAPVVTADHVREVIPPSAASANMEWKAMLLAIDRGKAADALREVGLRLDEGQHPLMVLGSLRSIAECLTPPARIGPAMDALLEADLAMKTSIGDARPRLEMLVVELCGTNAGAKTRR